MVHWKNKIDRPLAGINQKTLENKEKTLHTADTTEICRIIRESYEQLYAKKLHNLGEMDAFLETHNLPNLNQEEIENMNRPIMSKMVESVIKQLPTQKTPGPDRWWLHWWDNQAFKQGLRSILLKLFQNIEEEGTLPNSYITGGITLIK